MKVLLREGYEKVSLTESDVFLCPLEKIKMKGQTENKSGNGYAFNRKDEHINRNLFFEKGSVLLSDEAQCIV